MGVYQNFMENEVLNRNKLVNSIKQQVKIMKSYTQNSTELLLDRSQILQQNRAKENHIAIEKLKLESRQLKNENKKINNLQKEIQEKIRQFQQYVAIKKKQLFKGLLPARIQQFEQLQADESFVGDQCAICMEDVEIGRNMMRLDCDGQHTFCQVCIENWFADHSTCPVCRHTF